MYEEEEEEEYAEEMEEDEYGEGDEEDLQMEPGPRKPRFKWEVGMDGRLIGLFGSTDLTPSIFLDSGPR